LKRRSDQIALQQAAFSGNPCFFAGTDSAPHVQSLKESACGCAGVYSAPYALAMYAQVFDEGGQLSRLENFTSRFGAEFYHLPQAKTYIELIRHHQVIPESLPLGKASVVPLAAGSTLSWSIHAHHAKT
jgi:dihydroorotase